MAVHKERVAIVRITQQSRMQPIVLKQVVVAFIQKKILTYRAVLSPPIMMKKVMQL